MQILKATPTGTQTAIGLLMIRLALGAIFIAHGAQKVFTYGMGNVGDMFGEMGIPLAGVMGPVVSLFELAGGVAIILGLLTRPVSVGLAATMLGAIFFAHLSAGFFAPDGYEFPLMLLAAAAALVSTGAGKWSVDAALEKRATSHVGAESTERTVAARRAA